MPQEGNRTSLEEIVIPYLEIAGVKAAALVSTEGLLVTSAGGEGIDLEALGAQAAAALVSMTAVARELNESARIIALDLTGQSLILAPLTGEVFLVLLGGTDILGLIRR